MNFGIIGNIRKPTFLEVLVDILNYFDNLKINYYIESSSAKLLKEKLKDNVPTKRILSSEDLFKKSDIVIAFGGDGTILNVARMIGRKQVPILGINLGKLGFLAEVTVEEMKTCINEIIQHNYIIEDRMVLEARVPNGKKIFYGLNDIVIDRGAYKRVIELEVYVNNQYLVTYAADGLIVTTPTGSTAYSLAVGGPVVAPGTEVVMINPIAAHTLTARPLIIPDDSVIKVKSLTKINIHLTADGQDELFLKSPCEIVIKKTNYTVKLIKQKRSSYFDLLRAKLLWGKDIRHEK